MLRHSTYTCSIGTLSTVIILLSLVVLESSSASSWDDSFKNGTSKNSPRDSSDEESVSAEVWGISLGITAAIAIIISLSCVYCSCCPMYRRRHRNKPVILQQQQQQQFPMMHQNLAYSYDSSGNLVVHNQSYQISNVAAPTVASQAQMTATTSFYSPPHDMTVPPSYATATAPPPPNTFGK